MDAGTCLIAFAAAAFIANGSSFASGTRWMPSASVTLDAVEGVLILASCRFERAAVALYLSAGRLLSAGAEFRLAPFRFIVAAHTNTGDVSRFEVVAAGLSAGERQFVVARGWSAPHEFYFGAGGHRFGTAGRRFELTAPLIELAGVSFDLDAVGFEVDGFEIGSQGLAHCR